MPLSARLEALQESIIPVWVYDHDTFRVRWANPSALELWRAATMEELLERDLSDISPATRTRLDNYLLSLRSGQRIVEDWTLYPRGKPTPMTLHGSGVELDDGRLAILFQAVLKETPIEPSMLRGAESLRHTSLMVSLVNARGEVVFHNPAALRMFGNAASVASWFADQGRAVLDVIRTGETLNTEQLVQGLGGARWHSVRATLLTDPVSGERSALLQQLDVQERRTAEELAENRSRLIEELNRTVSLVEQQRQQILTLSAPIIDVGEQTLAVPLIGSLSTERISEISHRLLAAVQSQRRRFVILDLTGCSELDPGGALSLSRLNQAIEFLGSRAIVTGVHPALALGLLQAELGLSQLQSLRTLREGIEYCRAQASRQGARRL
jgi:anti-anti-sigma regulatory factor